MIDAKYPFSPKLVLFDLDGTLLDTMSEFANVASGLMAERHGMAPALARRRYLETSGLPFVLQIDIIAGRGEKNAETVRLFEEQKLQATRHVGLERGVRETLDELVGRGYLLAISSNNSQKNVNEFIRRENLQNVIKRWLGWHDAGRRERWFRARLASSKGEAHFSDFERVLKVPRHAILFVGDSLKDAEIAERCGIDFLPKVGTFNQEDFMKKFPDSHKYFISNISELNNLLP